MKRPFIRYLEGDGDTKYFRWIDAYPETIVQPDDSKEVQLQKLRRKLAIMSSVSQLLTYEPWLVLQELCLATLATNEIELHDALDRGDKATELRLRAEFRGITGHFQMVNGVTETMEKIQQEISDIETGIDPQSEIQENTKV
jgi:hypothetical protein